MRTSWRLAALVVVMVWVGGCGPKISKEDLEAQVLVECKKQMANSGGTCSSVDLVQRTNNEYIGFITVSSGVKRGVTVTVDRSSGEIIWKPDPL